MEIAYLLCSKNKIITKSSGPINLFLKIKNSGINLTELEKMVIETYKDGRLEMRTPALQWYLNYEKLGL